MVKGKSVSRTETRLKNPVTKGMLDDAVDTLLAGMDNLHSRFKGELDKSFDKVNGQLDNLERETTFVKREIRDLKADLSDTPTRKEHNELKGKVDRFHPSS